MNEPSLKRKMGQFAYIRRNSPKYSPIRMTRHETLRKQDILKNTLDDHILQHPLNQLLEGYYSPTNASMLSGATVSSTLGSRARHSHFRILHLN